MTAATKNAAIGATENLTASSRIVAAATTPPMIVVAATATNAPKS